MASSGSSSTNDSRTWGWSWLKARSAGTTRSGPVELKAASLSRPPAQACHGQVGLRGRVQFGQYPVGVLDEEPPCLGEPHAARGACEQGDAEVPLEGGQLLGGRRGGAAGLLCGSGDRAGPGDVPQQVEPARIEHNRQFFAFGPYLLQLLDQLFFPSV